jgi:glycosyltransferase involved in cell wall biosynthesis
MRIIIDARLYGLENGGLGRYVMNLISQLQKIDKENDYSLLLRKKYYNDLSLEKNFTKILCDFRHYSVKEQLLLPVILKKLNPNLVHFPHFNVPYFYKGKYVVTIHDLLMHKETGKKATTLPPFIYYPKRIGYKAVFANGVKKAQKIIVPSVSVKDEVVKYYGVENEKVIATYEGIDEIWFSETKGLKALQKYGLEDKKFFIYTGNAYSHKNLERVIEAISGTNMVFAIVCSRNVFTKRLEEVIKKNDAQNNVKLLGFVTDEDLRVLYKHSNGFVFASLSEGFGLPGLEAMASGTIALLSEIAVFKEVYKDNGIYFNPFDFTSIKKVLEDSLTMDKTKRKELVEKGRNYIKRYSWKKMAEETLQIYKSVTS